VQQQRGGGGTSVAPLNTVVFDPIALAHAAPAVGSRRAGGSPPQPPGSNRPEGVVSGHPLAWANQEAAIEACEEEGGCALRRASRSRGHPRPCRRPTVLHQHGLRLHAVEVGVVPLLCLQALRAKAQRRAEAGVTCRRPPPPPHTRTWS
jgi:hypothetical protein